MLRRDSRRVPILVSDRCNTASGCGVAYDDWVCSPAAFTPEVEAIVTHGILSGLSW